MGEAIRAARVARGMTRKELGEAMSLSDQYIYQVETGRRQLALETLWDLACQLDLDPHALDPRLAHRKPGQRKGG